MGPLSDRKLFVLHVAGWLLLVSGGILVVVLTPGKDHTVDPQLDKLINETIFRESLNQTNNATNLDEQLKELEQKSEDPSASKIANSCIEFFKNIMDRPYVGTKSFYRILFAIMSLVNLLTNVFTLAATWRRSSTSLTGMEIFITNLALSDLFSLTENGIVANYVENSFEWDLGLKWCKIFTFSRRHNVFDCTLIVLTIAFMRYRHLTQTEHMTRTISVRHSIYLSLGSTLISTMITIPLTYSVAIALAGCGVRSCQEEQDGYGLIFSFVSMMTQSIGPLVVLAKLYNSITIKLNAMAKRMEAHALADLVPMGQVEPRVAPAPVVAGANSGEPARATETNANQEASPAEADQEASEDFAPTTSRISRSCFQSTFPLEDQDEDETREIVVTRVAERVARRDSSLANTIAVEMIHEGEGEPTLETIRRSYLEPAAWRATLRQPGNEATGAGHLAAPAATNRANFETRSLTGGVTRILASAGPSSKALVARQQASRKRLQSRRRGFIVVIALFGFSTVPLNTFNLIQHLYPDIKQTDNFMEVGVIFYILTRLFDSMHVFAYVWLSPLISEELKRMWPFYLYKKLTSNRKRGKGHPAAV